MYVKLALAVLLLPCLVVLLHRQLFVSVDHWNDQALAPWYIDDVAINCGSNGNSTAYDGREWIGESASVFISGLSASSAVVQESYLGVDPVPYMTSRISASPFHFTFQVNPGQKFIRFHFYPALYRGFEESFDLFTVKAGPFILLNDFSAKLTCARLGVNYAVKEFCINVEQHGNLNITFFPSRTGKYAFVNGIEIISMPTGLYYTPDGDLGAPIVGQTYRFHSIDNRTALEMVERLNIGGSFISPVEDFGMFRRWNADARHFIESGSSLINYMTPMLSYANIPPLIAPPKVYQTSWKTARSIGGHQPHNFTWKLPINLGFGYLVRLHFCDFDAPMEARQFNVLIDHQIAEAQAHIMKWNDGTGSPVYKDYVVMMRGDKEASDCHLFIVLQAIDGSALGLLKGIEIFKLSNLDNCLATVHPASFKKVSTTRHLKIQRSFTFSSQSNVIGMSMMIIIFVVNITVYCIRKLWEANVLDVKDADSVSVERSYRRFPLADIKLATQNFSDTFIIGKGGFGKVYKGLIPGYPVNVAIKRLNSFSRQGASEFWAEIETLSKLRHIHLVSLIGYCNENREMILVYEYIPGGTVADNLYKFARTGKDCTLLSWEQRVKICIGAARGLDYLHTGSEAGIIHRDVKDTNILLDENFIPKISDFGLSQVEHFTQSKSYVSTDIKGTRGYMDPYYRRTRRLTRKSDVYSFGMVMLVVLSGRPAVDTSANPGEPESLLECFEDCLSRGEFNKIVDPNLNKEISPESLKEFVKSVRYCLQQKPKNRPTMAQLVGSLEQVLHLQLQEGPIISASADAALVFQPAQHLELETIHSGDTTQLITQVYESVVTPKLEEVTKGKGSTRQKENNRARKPFWNLWPWKTLQIRGEENAGCLDGVGVDKFVQFSYKELSKATDDFSSARKLDKNRGSAVYYSELRGEKVAIKMMTMERRESFLAELRILSEIHHRNLVRLIGYCADGSFSLVFEYLDNRSLGHHLHGSGADQPVLSWSSRVQIALDSARALDYIHEHIVPSYIHRNISPSKILIDKNFHAKVTGFDFTKSAEAAGGDTSIYTLPVATFCYLAPELQFGIVSPKTDVYAFGVVLYELISAKKPATLERDSKRKSLPKMFEEVLSLPDQDDDLLRKLVDSRLGDNYPFKSVVKMAQLARACTHKTPEMRPSMSSIMTSLRRLE